MSWGPRARSSYRLRKQWGRHVARQVRAQNSKNSSGKRSVNYPRGSGRTVQSSPSTSLPARPAARPMSRDERYARGAQAVIFWTVAAWVFCLFAGAAEMVGIGIVLILIEAVVWAVYQAQYNASVRDAALPLQEVQSPEAAQADFALSPEDAALDEDVKRFYADYTALRDGKAKQGTPPRSVAQEALRKQQEASRDLRAKRMREQEILEQELRWQRNAKHGQFGNGKIGEHDLTHPLTAEEVAQKEAALAAKREELIQAAILARQPANDPPAPSQGTPSRPVAMSASDIERQIQALEKKVREGSTTL